MHPDVALVRQHSAVPVGGCLALFKENWGRLTEDPWIRESVTGHKIQFMATPYQDQPPKEVTLDAEMSATMSKEIKELAAKKAIVRASESGFMSALFLVPKADKSWHPVLNLKPLNQFVVSPHFKMELARSVKNLVQPGDWLIKLDLKYAHDRVSPALPPVSMARGEMAVQSAAIWPVFSTTHLHKNHEASGVDTETAGDQNDSLPGRKANPGPVRREAATSPGLSHETGSLSGVSGEPQEECVVSNQEIPQWDIVIESDASKRGWGAHCQETSTGGAWMREESQHSINYLELMAAFLQTFAPMKKNMAILLRINNITVIAYLNKVGGTHSDSLSRLTVRVWSWCLQRNLLIHAEHLPGRKNVWTDWESRHTSDSSDWKLDRETFETLEHQFVPFSIDLFASHTNHQLPIYCSWRPDPSAWAVDVLYYINHMEGSQHVHVSPLLPHTTLPQQVEVRESIGPTNSPSMTQLGVVPAAVEGLDGCPSTVTTATGHNHSSDRSETPSCPRQAPTLSCMACIRRGLRSRGFLEGVVSIINQLWRSSTESLYSSAWRKWVS